MPPRPRSLRQPLASQAFDPAPPGRPGDPRGDLDGGSLRQPEHRALQSARRDGLPTSHADARQRPGPVGDEHDAHRDPDLLRSQHRATTTTRSASARPIPFRGRGPVRPSPSSTPSTTPPWSTARRANFATSDLAQFDKYFGLPDPPSFTEDERDREHKLAAAPSNGEAGGRGVAGRRMGACDRPGPTSSSSRATARCSASTRPRPRRRRSPTSRSSRIAGAFNEIPQETCCSATSSRRRATRASPSWPPPATAGPSGRGGDDPFPALPRELPGVVAVGGTSLYRQLRLADVETAWNQGGGGMSLFQPEPSYQEGVQTSGSVRRPTSPSTPTRTSAAWRSTTRSPSAPSTRGPRSAAPAWPARRGPAWSRSPTRDASLAGGTTLNGATRPCRPCTLSPRTTSTTSSPATTAARGRPGLRHGHRPGHPQGQPAGPRPGGLRSGHRRTARPSSRSQ